MVIRTLPKPHLEFFRLLERTFHRLHLLILLDLQSSPTVLPSPLSHPVETRSGPSKAYLEDLFTADYYSSSSVTLVCFWWTRWESNPRPECLHFEGITTIPSSFIIALNSFRFLAYQPHEPKNVVPGFGPHSLK